MGLWHSAGKILVFFFERIPALQPMRLFSLLSDDAFIPFPQKATGTVYGIFGVGVEDLELRESFRGQRWGLRFTLNPKP